MYIFINYNTQRKSGFTYTVLQYSPLQEKCGKYGNQTVQKGARSLKKNKFKSFKLEFKSWLLHHAFYSVDKFMLFWSYVDCKSMRAVLLVILIHFNKCWYWVSVLYCIVLYCIALYLCIVSFQSPSMDCKLSSSLRVFIWIANKVWYVQCHTRDNVDWINWTELKWKATGLKTLQQWFSLH
jgi:hypothetical protein